MFFCFLADSKEKHHYDLPGHPNFAPHFPHKKESAGYSLMDTVSLCFWTDIHGHAFGILLHRENAMDFVKQTMTCENWSFLFKVCTLLGRGNLLYNAFSYHTF